MGRAARYYPDRIAFSDGGRRRTFRELHDRVAGIAGYLASQGFKRGDRIALLLPNDDQYIELVYACAWLGLIAIPLNTRFSAMEIDHVLADATPHATYDETISRALDVFERVDRDVSLNGLNWFFDHCETISEKSIDRIARLGGGIALQHRMRSACKHLPGRC